MFKVGDKVKASELFMKERDLSVDWHQDLYNASINNEEIIVERVGTILTIYCESFTSPDKTWSFIFPKLQLANNDGKVRFTYTEVPSGTEYSNFLAWSKNYK